MNITQKPAQEHWRVLLPEEPGLVLTKILPDLSVTRLLLPIQ